MPRKTKSPKKTAEKAPAPKVVREPAPCCCGCGLKTKGGSFRPGHDMRLRGQIKRGAVLEPESKTFLAEHKGDPHYVPPVAKGDA
jgi:hypothetical protein